MINASSVQPMADRQFRFDCHKQLSCFTQCCANLRLVLTPYDIIRLKNRLQLSSDVFLERYTTAIADRTTGLPEVQLKMRDDESRRCPFVRPQGCTVYEDRPGACRLYPLGKAASKLHAGYRAKEYYFTVIEAHCLGWGEDKAWTLEAWLADQGLAEYDRLNSDFMDIKTGRSPSLLKALNDRQRQMYYMACYNLDLFRQFIFQSTFVHRFSIEDEMLQRIQTDDVALMSFAGRWLRFSLFGENTLEIKHPEPPSRNH